MFKGLPTWLVVKDSPANAGNIRHGNSISRWGSSPKGGHGNTLQHSCLENPMGRGTSRLHFIASHRVGHDWSESAHMHTGSKDQNSQMIFKEKFYRQNLKGVLQDTWPSSDWLVVRSQGGVPGIYLLVPTTLGLHSCAQPEVTMLHLGGDLVPIEALHDMHCYMPPLWRKQDTGPLLHYCWFPRVLTDLNSYCLNMSFGTQERSRRMKTFFLQIGNWGLEMAFVPGRAPKGPAGF